MGWSTACPDWRERIVAGRSLIPLEPMYHEEASAALNVIDQLRVVDMPGSPTFGEISRPWIREFVASVFGAYDPESGRRLIREWFLLISKKNTKSTTAGFMMLTALLLNWRQAGEFGILAPTVEVANNAFKPAADAIKADEELSALLQVQDHIRTITHRQTKATLQVVAADSETVAGKKWIITLIDEVWLFGKKNNAENMLREATGGLASRPEGCVIWLSTQSDDTPAGVFRQKLNYARGVRDGRIDDPQFLPVLYEFPEDMVESKAYLDPANFYVTNPNLGASVDNEFLTREFRKAQEAGPQSMTGFLAKHLDIEIGLALHSDRWAGADFWQRQADPTITLESLLDRSEVVSVGIDGGGNDDLYGVTIIGREKLTRDLFSWSRAYALPIVLDRRKDIADRLRDFEKQGDLVIVEKIEDACAQVVSLVKVIEDAGKLGTLEDGKKKAIAVDAASIKQTLDALNEAGYSDDQICAVSQGWRLGATIKSGELYLSSGVWLHAAQPLMDFCVSNAKVEPKGNAVLITKKASGSAKIDPLMAALNAIEVMSRNPVTHKEFQVFFAG